MLEQAKLKQLQDLINALSKEELLWISGYTAGIAANGFTQNNLNGSKKVVSKKISLAYGTETGNAKKLASQLAAVAKKKGVNAKLTSLEQYKISDLSKEEYFFLIISTQGDGEPPTGAKKFYDYIHENTIDLKEVKYSVLALGDTSYPYFCKAGEDVHNKFQTFGAKEIFPLQKCDVDYEDDAMAWFDGVLKTVDTQIATEEEVVKPLVQKKSTGKKYYKGSLSSHVNLNDRGSNKETYHIEIAVNETVDYEPGDALGLFPINKREVVEKIISVTGIDKAEIIETTKHTGDVEELLTKYLNICFLQSTAVQKYASITGQEIPNVRMDLLNLVHIYPVKSANQFKEVVKILPPIAPRLYSIASSPAAHEGELHLTVSRNNFIVDEEEKFGLCSNFLGDLDLGTEIDFYIHKNNHFKLPPANADLIMIGPGTGIAPFRSFLAERDSTGADGKNWLFFGDQKFTTDFLYQTELQQYFETGILTHINLAWSRDQKEKIYVQNRMEEHAEELFEWIANGAYIYVCGSKFPMSEDVEKTLLQIVAEQGTNTEDEAIVFLEKLKDEGRYLKDVY